MHRPVGPRPCIGPFLPAALVVRNAVIARLSSPPVIATFGEPTGAIVLLPVGMSCTHV